MILDKPIEINVAARNFNIIKQYYPHAQCGQPLQINQKETLILSVTTKVECLCENCGKLYLQEADRINRKPLRKKLCGDCMFQYGQNNMKQTVQQEENRKRKSIRVSEYYIKKRKSEEHLYKDRQYTMKQYAYEIRKISKRTYTKYKNFINPYKLPISRYEYHLDHIITIKFGYQYDLPFNIMCHPINLRLLPAEENLSRRFYINEKEMINHYNIINKILYPY